MLTELALTLAPTLIAQGGPQLHPADAGLYFEIPEPQAFAEAWMNGALPSLLGDEDLAGLYGLFGLEGVEGLLESLPPEVERDLLPILRGIDNVSVSLKLDLSDLEAQITEGAVVFGVLQDLQALYWETLWLDLDEDGEPESVGELGLDESMLIDPFGNPYVAEWNGMEYTWTCLGSDGAVGGVGLDADWTSGVQFESYVASEVLGVVGIELAVEWADDQTAAAMNGMLGMIEGQLRMRVPFSDVIDLDGEGVGLASLYLLDPEALGMPGSEPVEASLQQHGRTTVLTLGITSGRRVHDLGLAATAGAPSPDSLATVDGFEELLARVDGGEGVPLWRGAVMGFQGMPTEGVVAETIGNLEALFQFFGFHGAGSAWQTRIVDGSYHGRAVRPATGVARADLTDAIGHIPNEATFAQVGTMNPASFWSYVEGLAGDNEALFDMLDARGIDVEAGLMQNLGKTYAFWMEPVRSLAPPQMYMVIPVADGERLMATLDELVAFASELEPGLQSTNRPYRGSAYTMLDVGIPLGFSPTYTVIDGELWLSNSSTLIKRRIRGAAKGEDYERGAHPFFGELDAKDMQGAMYFDLGSMMGAYYSTGRAFAGMIPPDLGLPPGLAGELPEPDLFERHFAPETTVTHFVGDELHTFKRSSLGPEIPVLGFAAGLAVPATFMSSGVPVEGGVAFTFEDDLGVGGISVEPAGVPEVSVEEMVTDASLTTVDVGLLIYSLENGDYPASLDELVVASSSYEEGYLGMSEVPLDGWGNALVYERVSDSDYRLRSKGADGMDDQGAGDDMVMQ